ncbi:MAG: heparinase II/III family protein, partial [Tepidisphaeraceae bacterium]
APEWLLFHARDVEPLPHTSVAAPMRPLVHPLTNTSLAESDLFGQKGLAILRSGAGEHARAVTLRAGPTLNHGHFDEMNLNVYARGYEMSYDLGYGLGSTHTQVGWAKQTASHNTVLVDERSQLSAGRSGGSIRAFAAMPGLQFVSTTSAAPYAAQGVTRYDRTIAMIDADDHASYLLDVFRVQGGARHDYVFHGHGTQLTTDGLDLGPEQPGSLAGADVDWGARQGSDGDIKGIVGKEYWNPPPGNGLGFLVKPRRAPEPKSVWSATWEIDAEHDARLRLNMLPAPGTTVTTAEAPGIYPHFPKAAYVLARRAADKDLSSTFAAVIEPYGAARAVKTITPLGDASDRAVAVKIELASGRIDYLVCRDIEVDGAPSTWKDGDVELRFDGAFAKVSLDAIGPADVIAIGGSVTFDGVRLLVTSPAHAGAIERIDAERNVLSARLDLPAGDALAGEFLFVSNPAYAQASPYRIASVSRDGKLSAIQLAPTRLTIGQFRLTQDPTEEHVLPNVVPLEYAKSVVRQPSGYFRGKRATTADGKASTLIRDVDGKGLSITVDGAHGFAAGSDVVIQDVRAGDMITLPTRARAVRGADERWTVTTNGPATFTPPGGKPTDVAPSRAGVTVEKASPK